MSRMMIKTQVIDALLAGAQTTRRIREMTGLPSNRISQQLCKFRDDGIVEVTSVAVVYTGARPGHIWRLKEDANG